MGSYWAEVLADNPVVLLKMDEASGNLVDSMIGNNGVVSGTALTYGVAGPNATGIPRGVTFVSTSLATITDSADIDLGNGPFTFELWAKKAATTDYIVFRKGDDVATAGYQVRITASLIRLQDGSTSTNIRQTTTDTDLGWHHWVLTRGSAVSGKVWRDKVDVTTVSAAKTFSDNNLNLVIGNNFAGSMAAFAIYKTELTGTRIAAHFDNAGIADPIPYRNPMPTLIAQ